MGRNRGICDDDGEEEKVYEEKEEEDEEKIRTMPFTRVDLGDNEGKKLLINIVFTKKRTDGWTGKQSVQGDRQLEGEGNMEGRRQGVSEGERGGRANLL